MIAIYFDDLGKVVSKINTDRAFPNDNHLMLLNEEPEGDISTFRVEQGMLITPIKSFIPFKIMKADINFKLPPPVLNINQKRQGSQEGVPNIVLSSSQLNPIEENLRKINAVLLNMEQNLQSLEAKDVIRVTELQALKIQTDKIPLVETDIKILKTKVGI